MNRRVVIGVVLGILGLIVVTGIGILAAGGDRRLGATKQTTYAAGHFVVELDGNPIVVRSVSGCEPHGEVVKEQPQSNGVVGKHLGSVKHDPCVITVGAGMGKGLFSWIQSMLNRQTVEKNLTVVYADYNFKEQRRKTLQQAVLTKVRFPALDGASKDPALIELTIQPGVLQTSTANAGSDVKAGLGPKQATWLAGNFGVTVSGGIDTSLVASVSAFEVTQEGTQAAVGELRDYQKNPATFELNNLSVAVSASRAATWDQWFKTFVVDGVNTQNDEKTMTIEFLEPNMKNVIMTLSLTGVGIFRAVDTGGGEKIARRSYSLYVEKASLASSLYGSGGSATGGTPPPAPTPTPQPQATATVTEAVIVPIAATKLRDGDSFTIADGTNEPVTFEFDLDGVTKGVPIRFEQEASAEQVKTLIVEAINGVGAELEILAKEGDTQIQLVSEKGGAEGEEKILEFVENEEFQVRDKVVERGAPALPAPASLKAATGGEGEITLAWPASEGALGYLILFTTERGGEYRELDKTDATELTLAGLNSGVTHYFVIRALDGVTESANSPEAAAAAG